MTDEQRDFIIDMLAHFDEGDWPIQFDGNFLEFIYKEMKYLTVYTDNITGRTLVKLTGEISPEHLVIFLRDELNFYKDSYNKVIDHLDKVGNL